MTRPRKSTDPNVHRELRLVSPPLAGGDVKALQKQLNERCEHYGFPWFQIGEDGEYGRRTRRCAQFVAWLIGLSDGRLKAIGSDAGLIAEPVQRLLRDPQRRSAQDREREKRRKPERERQRKAHERGARAAVQWALKQVGTHESPPNSNRGPGIDAWQAYFGLSGEPWCGCFVGYAVKKIGKADCDTGFYYAGNIRVDALAGSHNLHDVSPARARPGDVVTFFAGGDDHVGLIRAASKNGKVLTVEGNTSSAHHDADGGIVEKKERPFSDVTCVARIERWG